MAELWKTTNARRRFYRPCIDPQLTDLAIGALAVDPNSPNTIMRGRVSRTTSSTRSTVWASTNLWTAAKNWTLSTGLGNAFVLFGISKIVVDPTNSNNVSLDSGIRWLQREFGVYKSTDGGANWTNTTSAAV